MNNYDYEHLKENHQKMKEYCLNLIKQKDFTTFENLISKIFKKNYKNGDYIYLKALFLIKKGNEYESLFYLTQLKMLDCNISVFQNEVNELIKKYNKKIDDYFENYWLNNNKKEKFEEILIKTRTDKRIIKYCLTGKKQKKYFYGHYNVSEIFYQLAYNFFDLDDKILNYLYKKVYLQGIFNFYKEYFKDEDIFLLKFLKKFKETKHDFFETIDDIITYYFYENGQICNNTYRTNDKIINILIDYIFPKYEKKILSYLKNNENNGYEINKIYFYILLKYDYNKYINFVKNTLMNYKFNSFSVIRNVYLFDIKDNDFTEKLVLKKVSEWFDYEVEKKNYDNTKIGNLVVNYLKTGLYFDETKEEILKIKEKYYEYSGIKHYPRLGDFNLFYFDFETEYFDEKGFEKSYFEFNSSPFFSRVKNIILIFDKIKYQKFEKEEFPHTLEEYFEREHDVLNYEFYKNRPVEDIIVHFIGLFPKVNKKRVIFNKLFEKSPYEAFKGIDNKKDLINFKRLYTYIFRHHEKLSTPIFKERLKTSSPGKKRVIRNLLRLRRKTKKIINKEKYNKREAINIFEKSILSEKLYSKKNWVEKYVNNEIINPYINQIVWGIFIENELQSTFRYTGNNCCSDINNNIFSISENDLIRIVHPIELNKKDIEIWTKIMSESQTKQLFKQLDREIYLNYQKYEGVLTIDDFNGIVCSKQKLKKYKWDDGYKEDGCNLFYHFKTINNTIIEIESSFYDDYEKYHWDFDVPGDMIIDKLIFKCKHYSEFNFNNKNYSETVEIPKKIISEIYIQLEKMFSTSQI